MCFTQAVGYTPSLEMSDLARAFKAIIARPQEHGPRLSLEAHVHSPPASEPVPYVNTHSGLDRTQEQWCHAA